MITDLTISEEDGRPFGLSQASLKRLGKVVLLAGPNGSGKSRYLQVVERLAHASKDARQSLATHTDLLAKLEADLQRRQSELPSPRSTQRVDELSRNIAENAKEMVKYQRVLEAVACDELPAAIARLADGSSSQRPIQNAQSMPLGEVRSAAQSVRQLGFGPAFHGMHAYLSRIARTLFDAKHPELTMNAEVTEEVARAAELNEIVGPLLGGVVGYAYVQSEVVPTVLGRPFSPEDLSPGQRVLLAWAIVLHMQRASLDGGIFFLDEPENHLHPSACVYAVRRLSKALGDHGQLWIATHSIALVAERGLGDLYLVTSGQITFAQNKLTDVLASLLGGPEGRENMLAMLRDAEHVASAKFLAECFESPAAVDTGTRDPQKSLLQKALARVTTAGRALKVLDYGAGKGRLASAIASSSTQASIQYFALNDGPCSSGDAEACQAHIEALSQGPGAFYWDDITKLLARERGAFDVVVLSNVLHEIPPDQWAQRFREIESLLGADGVVLIMEDLLPPIGELAHSEGFLMLDEFGVGLLFDDKTITAPSKALGDRLIVIEVAKASLGRQSAETRRAALTHVRESARKKIGELRAATERSPQRAREHAHHLVQYASASLALDKLI